MSFLQAAKTSIRGEKTAEAPVVVLISRYPLAAIAGSCLVGLAATRLVKSAFVAGLGLAAIQAIGRTFTAALPSRSRAVSRKRPVKLQRSPKRKAKGAARPKRARKAASVPKADETTLH